MPIIDGKSVSPDHAIHQGLCPECGAKLDAKNALGHAQGHWGIDPNSPHLSDEGHRRFNLVLDFIEIAKPKPHLEGGGESRIKRTAISNPLTPHTPKSMPREDKVFYTLSAIFAAVFT